MTLRQGPDVNILLFAEVYPLVRLGRRFCVTETASRKNSEIESRRVGKIHPQAIAPLHSVPVSTEGLGK